MDIQITPKKSEGLERVLEVSVPAAEVKGAEERAARRYASQVRLPGFRVGKAPPAVVRKRFAQPIRQEAVEALLQEAYQAVLDREGIKPASQPHVHDVKFEEDGPLTFELHLEVRPELELGRTTNFRVTRAVRPVTEPDVEHQLDHLREQRASWTPVEDKPLPGDMVKVELATTEDDGSMSEPRPYQLVLGSGQAIPGVEEVIMETTPGGTTERPVRWPDDFPDEAQRGKTKTVRVTVSEVKRKALPELDDALARELGDFDSLEALRTAVRDDLTRHAEREADAEVRQRLIEELIAANAFEVPASWVNQLLDAYVEAYQVPEEERERFREEFRGAAERQVKRDLIIDAVAEREGLAATEADIDDRVADVATKRNADPGQVYASLQKAGRIKELERSITEDKVFDWLLKNNTID
jgi:trigger factor